MIDSIALQTKLLNWMQSNISYWSNGTHGHTESFRCGVMHTLSDFQEKIILTEFPQEKEKGN